MEKPSDFNEIQLLIQLLLKRESMEKTSNFNGLLIRSQDIANMPNNAYKTVVINREGISPLVLFFKTNEENCELDAKYSDEKNIGKMIIPFNGRYFVYSLEFDIAVSAFYDKIIFIAEEKIFHVEYRFHTRLGIVNLFGTLDSEGHLLDNTLYAPAISGSYVVDEHDLDNSIGSQTAAIEKDILKVKKLQSQKEYVDFEYNNYRLNRIRKEKKSN